MQKPLKIRTKYQRMRLAHELAGLLLGHLDARVSNIGHEIQTVLGAPIGTLNNVLDCFESESKRVVREVMKTPTPEDYAAEVLRTARKSATGR